MLKVWADKNLTGAIDRHATAAGDYVFSYQPEIQHGREISLTMPHSLESYRFKNGLHPIFQMNLPEGRLRESIERTFKKRVQNFDPLSLLEVVGASQIGRLRFANDASTFDQVARQSVRELIAYNGTEDLLQDLLARFAGVSGISGVQPKVLIKNADSPVAPSHSDAARLTVKGATHIVKGWDAHEFPHLAANEFFCLHVAQQAGLAVPKVALSHNNRLLIVERFDLAATGEYLGFEDFCVLNGLGTEDKYQGSYEQLTKRIRDFVSPAEQALALTTFFKSLVVSCAVRNGDAHLKNFGVLYADTTQTVSLAPAFDIVSTTPYINNDSLALTLGGSKRFPNAKRLLDFAKLHCNLQPVHAARILDEVAAAILKTAPLLRQHMKDFPEFVPTGEAMLQNWMHGIDEACRR